MTETRPMPQHVAFIMDGNGRWAKARGMPRLEGHRQGVESVRKVCEQLVREGIPYATFYAFSTENWKRSQEEVGGLFKLFRLYFGKELGKLGEQGVRVRFIGARDKERLGADIVAMMEEAEAKTAGNTKLTALFAINYGGRDEIVRAARKLAAESGEIDEARFGDALDTAGVPDVDLMIRTSGEQRLSNFLLWQLAYAELVFTKVAWPDFGAEELQSALDDFMGRERRFGGVVENMGG
ncbi:MAG: di-trans,poly-cis-decaprenylcistransferase [Pseudomonadaceae bacterium]|nr:di-trans,poly-cis-decaprenylcistransferase [Pseudomonadaceae bacterium]